MIWYNENKLEERKRLKKWKRKKMDSH
jgi:hypothetical protein